MTAEQILTELKNLNITTEEFAYGDMDDIIENGIGEWDEVAQKGGEGEGDEWFSIKYFKYHDVYIKTEGWHSSYDGVEFSNGYGEEVKPVSKVITVFEAL